jgi:hypothetical protein
MNDRVGMTPVYGLHELENVETHHLGVKALRLLFQALKQVLLHVLKHQVKLRFSPKRLRQAHNIVVPKHAQQLHLA